MRHGGSSSRQPLRSHSTGCAAETLDRSAQHGPDPKAAGDELDAMVHAQQATPRQVRMASRRPYASSMAIMTKP